MIGAEHPFWIGMVLVWGAAWGSFANVVCHRLPLGESVVRPASRCGSCRQPIRAWHNVPVLSWLLLRGRCANPDCRAYFSVRYPLVEAAMACLSLAVWWLLTRPIGGGRGPELEQALIAWFFLFFFVADLVVIALIDLDTMRIPDVLSLPAIPAGLVCALMVGDVTGVDLYSSIIGMLVGGGTLLAVTYGYFALTGREGMGLGDYRLMAAVGAFLGWKSLLFLLVGSALQGIVFFVVARVTGLYRLLPALEPDEEPDEGGDEETQEEGEPAAGEAAQADGAWRHMAIPFGPFIVLSALEWLLFQPYLLALFDRWVYMP